MASGEEADFSDSSSVASVPPPAAVVDEPSAIDPIATGAIPPNEVLGPAGETRVEMEASKVKEAR